MSFRYHFGGIGVASGLEFARLRTARPRDTVRGVMTLVRGDGLAPDADEIIYSWPGRFGMQLGLAGKFWRVSIPSGVFLIDREADEVRIFAADANEDVLKSVFVRRLLPRLIKLKGAATYHAASLAYRGRGILLMGPSGAGKSTMTAGLALADDWEILGDDMAILWDDDGEVITPAGSDIALWPTTSGALALPPEQLDLLSGYDGKLAFGPARLEPNGGDFTDAWAAPPMRGLFFIERGNCHAPTIEPMDRQSAMKAALRQMVLFDPSAGAGLERVHSVIRLNAMLANSPAWRLRYPATFSRFAEVSEVIIEALGN